MYEDLQAYNFSWSCRPVATARTSRSNVSRRRFERLISGWWHWRLGLVSVSSLRSLSLVSVSRLLTSWSRHHTSHLQPWMALTDDSVEERDMSVRPTLITHTIKPRSHHPGFVITAVLSYRCDSVISVLWLTLVVEWSRYDTDDIHNKSTIPRLYQPCQRH